MNEITKEEFEDYEAVRSSGITNMFDIRMVESLSGLSRETIMKIMRHYSELNKKFPGVRE